MSQKHLKAIKRGLQAEERDPPAAAFGGSIQPIDEVDHLPVPSCSGVRLLRLQTLMSSYNERALKAEGGHLKPEAYLCMAVTHILIHNYKEEVQGIPHLRGTFPEELLLSRVLPAHMHAYGQVSRSTPDQLQGP